ncbi:MAG: ABC transporter substrate-binding protein [Rhodospirillales bacterium]
MAGAAIGATAEEPKQGGQLVVALNADIRGTNAGVDRDANTDSVMHHVVETLVAHTEDMGIGPLVADSWEVSDDGKTYTFTLRPDITFHNGAPVTAKEVKWSWDRLLNPDTAWSCLRYYDGSRGAKVEGVEALDDRQVRFTLAEPSALFLIHLANIQCSPAVLHPDSLDAEGNWSAPVATGPYKIKERRPGEYVLLERFEGYKPRAEPRDGYAGARVPHLDEIKFLVTPESSVELAGLYAGDINVLPGLSPSAVEEVRGRGIEVQVAQGFPWSTLLINTRDPLLSDVRMRRAIAHAIDLGQVAEASSFGLVGANPSAVPQPSGYHSKAHLDWPAFDPAATKALLAEAGYDGQVITLQTNKKYQDMFDNAVIVQSFLTAAGMTVELEVLDWATQLENYFESKFMLSSFGYSARLDPALMYGTFVGNKDVGGWYQWESEEATALVDRAAQSLDPAERKALFEELHALMAKDIPIYGLYNDALAHAVGPGVGGYKLWASNKPRFWGVWLSE